MSSITPPSLVGDQAVLDLVSASRRHLVGGDSLEPVEDARPVERQPAHVADVEKPDPLPHRLVLFDDGRVLDGHRPAAELDEPAAVRLDANHGAGSSSSESFDDTSASRVALVSGSSGRPEDSA